MVALDQCRNADASRLARNGPVVRTSRGWRQILIVGVLIALVLIGTGFLVPAIAIELRADPGGTAAGDIVITRSDVEILLRVDNDTLDKVDLTLVARPVRISGGKPCREGEGCTIALYLRDPDGDQKLSPGDERKVPIPALGSQALVVKGKVPDAGRYVLELAIGEKSQATIKQIAIRREQRELPQGALKLGPVGLLPMAFDGSTPAIPFRIAAATDSVHIDRFAFSLLKADATGAFTRPVGWPNADPKCPSGVTTTDYDVKPGAPLSCTVRLPEWIAPGVYRIHAEAKGPDLKTAEAEADVRVRAPWTFAFLSLFVGSLVGAWAVSWSRDGRERLLMAIQAQEVREQYLRFESNVAEPGHYTRQLITAREQQLAGIIDRLRFGDSPLTYGERISRLNDLLPLIGRLYNIERQFDHPATSEAVYEDAKAELARSEPDLAICRTRLDALETELRRITATARTAADLSIPLFSFSWTRGLSSDALRRLLNRNDRVLSWVGVVVAVLIGMTTLWSNNSTWGSLADWLVAFLTGVAITIGGTVSLQQLSQNYQLGSLVRR